MTRIYPTAQCDRRDNRCLPKNRGSTPEQKRLWRDGIYKQIREVMPVQGNLSIEQMCRLTEVSRAGFYRSLQERLPVEENMEVRSAIQQIAVEHRRHRSINICASFRE